MPLKYRVIVLQKRATKKVRRGEIEFINAESGMPLSEASEVVLGYSHARIRVNFKPREVGQVRAAVVGEVGEMECIIPAMGRERLGV